MTVERSGLGELTTKAEYISSYEHTVYSTQSTSGQWGIVDNYTIYAQSTGTGTYSEDDRRLQYVLWNGYSGLNYDLEYSVVIREYNSSTVLFESGWISNNEQCACYAKWDSSTRRPSFTIYVRRNEFDDNGNRRTLVPSDMRPSFFRSVWKVNQTIEQTTAIPQNWLETTTASFENPMDTYTTIIPTDYDISSSQYDPLLEIPSKIDTAINLIILGFGRIMNFKYITFVVCFVLIVGLVAWLIH